jgi:methionine salvage enolase-phosphatase E1
MTKNYDISFAVPKIDSSEYKNIQLEITTSSNILFTEFVFQNSERIEVEAIEYSYFDLKKGEKLDYLLVQEPKAE